MAVDERAAGAEPAAPLLSAYIRRLEEVRPGRLVPSRRSVVVSLAFVVFGAASYVVARATPIFAIDRIEVRAPKVVAPQVRAALASLEGESLVGLDASELERRIASVPDVAGVTYDRAFPNTLIVSVWREPPVAVVRNGRRAWLVSGEGRVLRPVALSARRTLPRVWLGGKRGLEAGRRLTAAEVVAALRVARTLRVLRLRLRVHSIGSGDGGLEVLLRSGVRLYLGENSEIALKLAVAERVVPALDAESRFLDLSVPTRPVASAESQLGD